MTKRRSVLGASCVVAVLVACGGSDSGSIPIGSGAPATSAAETTAVGTIDADVQVRIDVAAGGAEISPLILGVSGDLSSEEMRDAGITVDSWGGNPSSRYNYMAGHFWNSASDFEFRNTDYGQDGDSFRRFVAINEAAGAATRVAVPTLGWVAKDATSCSFPAGDGCDPQDEANCADGGPVADPRATSIESTPESVAAWIAAVQAEGHELRFIAMDNEPELWGYTHYDVHPECPTYEEILETYLRYATAVREVAPDAELMGPVMCCWFDYWRSAPGPADGSGEDFLSWFLRRVREYDEANGVRTLDVVDVHYYPQSGIYNGDVDDETSARRLRSVQSLYDPDYSDESWITEPIAFIPRMLRTIEASYPGTPLAISEWNFGADGTVNGALAIADVLGVYGREGVYAAMYWRAPAAASPGYLAFKMHGNYDGRGSRFTGATLPAQSDDVGSVGAYAARDSTSGTVRVMLINKEPAEARTVALDLTGFVAEPTARTYTYGGDDPTQIVAGSADPTAAITIAPSTIVVLELTASG